MNNPDNPPLIQFVDIPQTIPFCVWAILLLLFAILVVVCLKENKEAKLSSNNLKMKNGNNTINIIRGNNNTINFITKTTTANEQPR